MKSKAIDEVLAEYRSSLLQLPNVVGVAIGSSNGKEVIQVLVTQKVPRSLLAAHEIIPSGLGDFIVEVKETGAFTAHADR